MNRTIALALMILIASPPSSSALDAKQAAYVGGTLSSYRVGDEPIEGHLDLRSAQVAFVPDRGPHAAEVLSIDYSAIRSLEFGQRTGRRPVLVAGAMALLGPFGLPALSARRRTHYLTVVYADGQGKNQVVVLALGKNVVRPTLAALEMRTGISVEYQDEEARKWSR